MRTNIDIDDELLKKAMAATNGPTKRAVVEQGLQLLVNLKAQEGIRKLRGTVVWRGHDDDWFASDEEIVARRKQAERKAVASEASKDKSSAVAAGAGDGLQW
jgi:Arc/MetJ family transcription regulator